jgi:amino acid transporter
MSSKSRESLVLTWNSIRWCTPYESVIPSRGPSEPITIVNESKGAEVKNPERRVPQSMVYSVVINGILSFAFIICLMFTLGDLNTALSTPTGYPIIAVFYEATHSKAATNTLMALILFTGIVAMFGSLASVSRLTWAFARDHGLPFSKFFTQVNPTTGFQPLI